MPRGNSSVYRFEIAKQGRAGCQNTACKKDKIKIQKGELRFGVLVEIPDYPPSFKWKHWGCVSPAQIAKIQEIVHGLDYNDDKDMDCLDGWDELTPEARDRIRQALKDGHVADDEWKGLAELNRPGMKGINHRSPVKVKPEDEAAQDEAPTPVKPKVKRGKKVKTENQNEEEAAAEPKLKPKKSGTKKVKAEPADNEEPETEPDVKPKKSRKRKTADDEDEAETEAPAPKKARKPLKSKIEQGEDSAVGFDGTADVTMPEASEPGAKPAAKNDRKVKQEAVVDDEAPAAEPKNSAKAKNRKVKAEEVADAPVKQEKGKRGKRLSKVKVEPEAEDEEPEGQDGAEDIRPSAMIKAEADQVEIDAPAPVKKEPKTKGKDRKVKPEPEQQNGVPADVKTEEQNGVAADVKNEAADADAEPEVETKPAKKTSRVKKEVKTEEPVAAAEEAAVPVGRRSGRVRKERVKNEA